MKETFDEDVKIFFSEIRKVNFYYTSYNFLKIKSNNKFKLKKKIKNNKETFDLC